MAIRKYKSRKEAGKILTEKLKSQNKKIYGNILEKPDLFMCFAIPNGGVPVAEGFCSQLRIPYDILILRKIKIPYNPEAGFGSVTTDGTILINEDLLGHLKLSQDDIDRSINKTKTEIKERLNYYGKNELDKKKYLKVIKDKNIFLIDDGLASGFTMLAAIKMVRNYHPKSIYVAIPTAPQRTIQRIQPNVESIICPDVKNALRFAVANAYQNWYDLSKKEAIDILEESEYYADL